jgi:recombinational DNA repair ATPase RecF
MDNSLLDIVLNRLADVPLAEPTADLLVAALDSDENLTAQLGGQAAQRSAADRPENLTKPEPCGAYLRSLTVTGFRGIGQPATLNLQPSPGLTVVVGRNGSGKSSFAEALEVLLTGELKRWENLSAVWRQGWRSLHQPDPTEISAEILLDGVGPAQVQRTWAPDADFTGSSASVLVPGQKKEGLERLGWSEALANYRPFLSHSELEAFFGSPSGLYELLASVLGLEDLTLAATRLAQARLAREHAFRDVKKKLPDLLAMLEDAGDERAGPILDALSRTWDLAAAKEAATGAGVSAGGGDLARLRSLGQLTAPTPADVRDAVTRLQDAASELDTVAGSPAGEARKLAGLLTTALSHHEAHGDGDCPVCGRPGALTKQWHQDTRAQVGRLTAEARAAESAERAATDARRNAVALLQPPPSALMEEPLPGVDAAPARAAWHVWASPPDSASATSAGLRALASHLELALEPLQAAVRTLRDQATTIYSERQDAWSPVAAAVCAWCTEAENARDGMTPVSSIKEAENWLKAATDDIRNERLAPLAKQARSIWAMLRQESNVDLGAIRLAGSSTQRRVELHVSVDGAPGSALGVMSQGEVNALALAVFLPRVRLPESPFRFLVIDDPVQAMDPAKVDGLARVLEKAAADRQVIVFTHDNRLAQAIRQLKLRATILEVTRRPISAVDVRSCLDPVEQALQDAGALAADSSVPTDIAARVVPGLCRTALEAAFTGAVWRRDLRAGRRHGEIEADLESCTKLNSFAALALAGDAGRGGEVLPRLNSWGRKFGDIYQALNRGAHGAHAGDLGALVRDARQLTDKIRAGLP